MRRLSRTNDLRLGIILVATGITALPVLVAALRSQRGQVKRPEDHRAARSGGPVTPARPLVAQGSIPWTTQPPLRRGGLAESPRGG